MSQTTIESVVIFDEPAEFPTRHPWHVVAALRGLLFVKHFLPKSMFLRIYDTAFSLYRRKLRKKYISGYDRRNIAHEKAKLVHESMPHSLVGWQGLEATYDAVIRVHQQAIEGDLVECGVAEGGSALLMARVTNHQKDPRKLWLFDSYEGLPEPTSSDFESGKTGSHSRPLPKGSCLGTIEQVSQLLFETYPLPRNRVELVKGWFEDTLHETKDRIDGISVLRLDGDWYESTLTCFQELYDLVTPGGVVILDDFYSCFGCKKATIEFLETRGEPCRLIADGRGGAYFYKP